MKKILVKKIKDRDYLVILFLFIFCFGLYINSLGAPFVFDDFHMITDNAYIKHSSGIVMFFFTPKLTSALISEGMYRPLLMLSFSFNYFINGLNPVGYRVINILIHFLNSFLVFSILRLLIKKDPFWPAFLASLFFLAHPVYTEAVIYISCRSTLMSSFFFLFSFLAFIKMDAADTKERAKQGLIFSSFLAYSFGLLTKEVVIVLPFVLIVYDFILISDCRFRLFWSRFKRYHLIFIFLSLIYLAWRKYLFGAIGTIYPMRSTYENILSQVNASIFYIKLYLLPTNLCVGRSVAVSRSIFDPGVFFSCSLALLSVLIGFLNFKKHKVIAFAIFWYWITLLPKFIGSLGLLAAEHQLYLPSFAFILILALIIEKVINFIKHDVSAKRLKILFIILFVLILIWNIALTINRNSIWQDEYSIWYDNIKKSPASWGAYNNLALAVFSQGHTEEAQRYFEKALEELKGTNAVGPKANIYNNIANIYLSQGKLELAKQELLKVLNIKPGLSETHINLGVVYGQMGDYKKEAEEYKKAILIDPGSSLAHRNLGIAYWYLERKDEAILELRKAIELNPDYLKGYAILGLFLENSGRFEEAIEVYEAARKIKLRLGKGFNISSEIAADYYNLGVLFGKIGDPRAIDAFQKALKLDPKFAAAHNNLAITYLNIRSPNIELARKHARLALKYGYKVRANILKQLGISPEP